jgi:tetratricopeptide (TPR) repeat protein
MPEKKKTVAAKASNTPTRMTKPQAHKNPKSTETPRTAAAPARAQSGADQLAAFESAMKLFHTRRFQEAHELFQRATSGPERDVANRAGLHAAMCQRRLSQETVSPSSPEEQYNYGVALLNARKVAEAREQLERALLAAPGADHIHYALALARALGGDLGGACDHLRRAIELEPRNRMLARQDADFAPVANQPAFQALLYPEKKTW